MAANIAKEKVWRTHKNVLVKDGHEDAAVLVARRGGTVEDEELKRYKNADSFFVDPDSREGEAAQREDKTVPKPWTHAEIAAYRNAREGDEPTRSTLERVKPSEPVKIASAEKARRSRPGPEKTSVKVKKVAAKK
jgi:hypothetical protein